MIEASIPFHPSSPAISIPTISPCPSTGGVIFPPAVNRLDVTPCASSLSSSVASSSSSSSSSSPPCPSPSVCFSSPLAPDSSIERTQTMRSMSSNSVGLVLPPPPGPETEQEQDVDFPLSSSLIVFSKESVESIESIESIGPESDPNFPGLNHLNHDPSSSTTAASSRPPLLSAALAAFKKNFFPGLVLQILLVALLVAYFTSSHVQSGFDAIASLKSSMSFGFSFLSTGIFGGLIPTLIAGWLAHRRERKEREGTKEEENVKLRETDRNKRMPSLWLVAVYLTVAWGVFGIEVDAFYRLQVFFFGDTNRPEVVVKKVLVDQLAWNILIASNQNTLIYLFKDVNFSLLELKSSVINRDFWFYTIPLVIMSIWFVWIPTTVVIYILPNSFQVIIFNIVLCFWSSLVALLVNQDKKKNRKEQSKGEKRGTEELVQWTKQDGDRDEEQMRGKELTLEPIDIVMMKQSAMESQEKSMGT